MDILESEGRKIEEGYLVKTELQKEIGPIGIKMEENV